MANGIYFEPLQGPLLKESDSPVFTVNNLSSKEDSAPD